MNPVPLDSIDKLPCGWLSLDREGAVLAVNSTLCCLLGAEPQNLQGRPFDSLLTRSSRVLYQSYLQPILRLHGHVEEFALAFDLGAGKTLDALIYCSTAKRGDGELNSGETTELIVASLRKRRSIEDEMLRVKRAADHAPGMIFQLMQLPDGNLHFPYTSEAIRRMYGVTSEQASKTAESLLCFLDTPARAEMCKSMEEAARNEADWHAVFAVTRTGMPVRWHEAMATPRRLADGVILWHGHCADVTDRRELENAVAETAALERVHQARSEFLARVSHELRTPLNGILGFAQLLAADQPDNLSAVQRERLELLGSSGRHLLTLVNEVLEVTSIEAGQLNVDLQSLELRPLLQRALTTVQADAHACQVKLLPVECDGSLHVQCNAQRFHQVLVNLLSNAVKYNRPEGTVQLLAQRTEQGVRVDVVDTGRGLSPQQRAALFQPFNRLGAENTNVAGNGLGLVITKHLLELMRADLTVSSELGLGSCFSISMIEGQRLPTACAEEVAFKEWAADAPARLHTSGKVLYVEDDEVNSILMTAVLGMRPRIEMRIARSGAQALQAAREQIPDLLLLDMHLPDTNGIELLAALRQIDGLQTVPAIMVSAGARQQDIERARASGFGGYWTKPLDIDGALAELDQLLGLASRE